VKVSDNFFTSPTTKGANPWTGSSINSSLGLPLMHGQWLASVARHHLGCLLLTSAHFQYGKCWKNSSISISISFLLFRT
jgi:hypothetical protein